MLREFLRMLGPEIKKLKLRLQHMVETLLQIQILIKLFLKLAELFRVKLTIHSLMVVTKHQRKPKKDQANFTGADQAGKLKTLKTSFQLT